MDAKVEHEPLDFRSAKSGRDERGFLRFMVVMSFSRIFSGNPERAERTGMNRTNVSVVLDTVFRRCDTTASHLVGSKR